MVQGWFPSPTACSPILPVTTQVRKRWHRRLLDRLNQLTVQEVVAVSSVFIICGVLSLVVFSWSCPPLSGHFFRHCARPASGSLTDGVTAIPLPQVTKGKPEPHNEPASDNTTAAVMISSMHVADGDALRVGEQFIVGPTRYRITDVKFKSGHRGAAEISLQPWELPFGGMEDVQAPVDENEAKEDILFGVGATELAKYQRVVESEQFACLVGGKSVQMPLAKINDDYCDCDDGSDEPGTPACQGNRKFFCAHTGEREQSIWSTAVNDGVCDCCDGSDESTSGVECPHIC